MDGGSTGGSGGQAELLGRAARGEEAACRTLYGEARPRVLRMLQLGFPALDRDEVEDVVQDTFVRAFRALPRLKEARTFEPWLLTIARNRALTQLARRKGAADAEEALGRELEAAVPALPEALEVEKSVAVVQELVASLPPGPERETVELFYVQGELSAREIAERLGVGKSAVTMRLERFRARVKQELLRRLLAAGVG